MFTCVVISGCINGLYPLFLFTLNDLLQIEAVLLRVINNGAKNIVRQSLGDKALLRY